MTTAPIRSRLAIAGAVRAVAATGGLTVLALASLPAQAAYFAETRDAVQIAASTLRDHLAVTGDAGSFVAVGGVSQAPDAGALAPTVAAPVPEPETYALLLAGLGVVGWAARRRASR